MRRGGPCAAAPLTLPLASVPRLWAVSGSWARGHQRLGHPHGGSGRRRASWRAGAWMLVRGWPRAPAGPHNLAAEELCTPTRGCLPRRPQSPQGFPPPWGCQRDSCRTLPGGHALHSWKRFPGVLTGFTALGQDLQAGWGEGGRWGGGGKEPTPFVGCRGLATMLAPGGPAVGRRDSLCWTGPGHMVWVTWSGTHGLSHTTQVIWSGTHGLDHMV